MSPSLLLLNPHVTDQLLAGGGMLLGLSTKDVRELSTTRVPVWAVVGGALAIGFALGLVSVRNVPDSWVKSLRHRSPKA